MRVVRIFTAILVLSALAVLPAQAGRTCEAFQPDPLTVHKALQLALATRNALEASGAQVALVGRVGRDMSKHGLRYSHMAFALRDHPKGRWFLTHMLNDCATPVSTLYDEGLGNFFLDDVFEFEAIVIVPSRELQQRLLAVQASALPLVLHEKSYSLIAHPFATRHQNSNQWVLEQIAAALAPPGQVARRADAQRWLLANGYTPSIIRIAPVERIGARLFATNIYFNDHSPEEMQSGLYQAVTVESVIRFVRESQALATQHVVRLQ